MAHVATHTHVGNMNQYLLKSIKLMISEKVVALATAALVRSAVDDVDIKGDICSMISGCIKSRTYGALKNILEVTDLVAALVTNSLLPRKKDCNMSSYFLFQLLKTNGWPYASVLCERSKFYLFEVLIFWLLNQMLGMLGAEDFVSYGG